jgi:hypothetical protein
VVNLSNQSQSRLLFQRATIEQFKNKKNISNFLKKNKLKLDDKAIQKALTTEKKLAYMVPSGRYWKEIKKFDPHQLNKIDHLWLKTSLYA